MNFPTCHSIISTYIEDIFLPAPSLVSVATLYAFKLIQQKQSRIASYESNNTQKVLIIHYNTQQDCSKAFYKQYIDKISLQEYSTHTYTDTHTHAHTHLCYSVMLA